MRNYKCQSMYPSFYENLETALDQYAEDHDLEGKSYQEIARNVLEFCDNCFNYINDRQQRVKEFLQGVGLNIAIYNSDIYELAYKDGILSKNDTDDRHITLILWQ
jgi:hypothetical protein